MGEPGPAGLNEVQSWSRESNLVCPGLASAQEGFSDLQLHLLRFGPCPDFLEIRIGTGIKPCELPLWVLVGVIQWLELVASPTGNWFREMN